jgi:hypothetical protein
LTKLKIALLAPMPRAKVRTATADSPGLRASARRDRRRSCRKCSTTPPREKENERNAGHRAGRLCDGKREELGGWSAGRMAAERGVALFFIRD